jgi:hypothetical protein
MWAYQMPIRAAAKRQIEPMPRRPAAFTQADVARAIRAAKQAGAESIEVRPDGTITVLLKSAAPQEPTSLDHEIIL